MQRPPRSTPRARPPAKPLPPSQGLHWQQAVEQTVTGLGYELVDCERSSQGLLRVYIDRVPGHTYEIGPGEVVTVDDCEKVTRQLQYVLEVEGSDYSRLEVSSPGLDRPLRRPEDFARFAGLEVDVTLRQVFQGRRKYRGVLEVAAEAAEPSPAGEAGQEGAAAAPQAWRLVFNDGKQDQVLSFTLDEIREARLVPVVDFKGRSRKAGGEGQDSGGRKE